MRISDWSSDVCSSDLPEHVRILGRTREWLRYNVPSNFVRRDSRGHYKGQKQIWFLLRLVGRDSDVSLRATHSPEFDAWRWSPYWVPLEAVIEFKRAVYTLALNELAAVLFKRGQETRYLRQRVQSQHASLLPSDNTGHARTRSEERGLG